MSNQTFYFILFLGLVLIAGVVILLRRTVAAGRENAALTKKLFDAENHNVALQNQLVMYQRKLRQF